MKEEKLKPLPTSDRYQKFMEEVRKVHKDGLLSFGGVRYGVPWQYSGKEVGVRDKLGLLSAAIFLDALLERAQRENTTYLEFLNDLLKAELSERQRRNIEVRSKLARLPYRKTLNEFNFTFQPSIDEKLIRELATMAFVYRAENVIFFYPPGVGETRVAVCLAIEALSQGMSVYFTSLSRLIEDLHLIVLVLTSFST